MRVVCSSWLLVGGFCGQRLFASGLDGFGVSVQGAESEMFLLSGLL